MIAAARFSWTLDDVAVVVVYVCVFFYRGVLFVQSRFPLILAYFFLVFVVFVPIVRSSLVRSFVLPFFFLFLHFFVCASRPPPRPPAGDGRRARPSVPSPLAHR